MKKAALGRISSYIVVLGGTVCTATIAIAADVHVIAGTQQVTWTYNGQKSTASKPLIVDDLKVGDIVEIDIPAGPIPHGFVTIRRPAGQPVSEARDLVVACGEDAGSKPNAVLRETNCGAASNFGIKFSGKMQLQVMSAFSGETDFWCVVHKAGMAGVLKIKQ